MSFNFIPVTNENKKSAEELPVIYELARDLETLEILTKNAKFYYVSKNDAIKIWVLKVLHKQCGRYEHNAYSSDYGNEIRGLFGRYLNNSLLKSELKRLIEEALLANPYITAVSNFTFERKGSYVKANFTVGTIYGDFIQEVNMEDWR